MPELPNLTVLPSFDNSMLSRPVIFFLSVRIRPFSFVPFFLSMSKSCPKTPIFPSTKSFLGSLLYPSCCPLISIRAESSLLTPTVGVPPHSGSKWNLRPFSRTSFSLLSTLVSTLAPNRFNCATFTASVSSVPPATLIIWRATFPLPMDRAAPLDFMACKPPSACFASPSLAKALFVFGS